MRRELTPEELTYLLQHVEHAAGANYRLSGPVRAMAYRVALGTGFRAQELRSLTPASFDLDGDPPTVTVAAAYSKRRRLDAQPIRADLAELYAALAAGVSSGTNKCFGCRTTPRRCFNVIWQRPERLGWPKQPRTTEHERREQSDFLRYQNAAGDVADFH